MSRELVQLEDLLQWAEGVHGTAHEDVKEAQQIKNEANKVLKVPCYVCQFFVNRKTLVLFVHANVHCTTCHVYRSYGCLTSKLRVVCMKL